VRALLDDAPFVYPTTVSFRLAATTDEQAALVHRLCDEVLAFSPAILALGGYVQKEPMAVVGALLSTPDAPTTLAMRDEKEEDTL